jgi:colicin import membrane protein
MATQPQPQPPKPAPRPEPPKPNPKPDDDAKARAEAAKRPPGAPEPVRDERREKMPGTPTTPPEGHSHAEPAPGQPGGPSRGAELAQEPLHTIADEQRRRSQELMDKGVETVKAEHDERSEEDKQSRPVTGVAHRPIEPHETSRR